MGLEFQQKKREGREMTMLSKARARRLVAQMKKDKPTRVSYTMYSKRNKWKEIVGICYGLNFALLNFLY